MNLNKTTASTSEPAAQKTSAKTPATQALKSSAPHIIPKTTQSGTPRSVSSLISAVGLPADKLSASIISFARFFSLPLKPEMLAAIRRQAFAPLAQQAQQSAETENSSGNAAAKTREALSLAAAAAESKGVELAPKGLEAFAEAVDPDWQKRQESEGRRKGRRNKDENDGEEEAPQKTGAITAEGIEKLVLESAKKDTLLSMLNKLPGKNGRWVVLPFSFCENGRDFDVSLRILLETEQMSNNAVCMALDIAESSAENGEKRWLFVLESTSGSSRKLSLNRLTVHIQPDLPSAANAKLVRELAELFNIPSDRVYIRNKTESFPLEQDYGGDLLRAIDEAV